MRNFTFQKKTKKLGFRTIHTPWSPNLANSLKILNNNLSSIYCPQDCVHGFIQGRSIKTNATQHLAKKLTLSVDIKDFYGSISQHKITTELVNLGFKEHIAKWIAQITCIDGYLVQGFHTSPTLANIAAQELDDRMLNISGESIVYTRYADDLYFSTDKSLPNIEDIEQIVLSCGFTLNKGKTKLMKRGGKQYVTGLSIFDQHIPRIPKRTKRNIRLEIFYIKKIGYLEHTLRRLHYKKHQLNDPEIKEEVFIEMSQIRNRLWGWNHFINSIEPDLGKRLYKDFHITDQIYLRSLLNLAKTQAISNHYK